MGLDNSSRDGQAQPSPTMLCREEGLEHPFAYLRRDARPPIDDIEMALAAFAARANRNSPMP
jgi:hypothetical protein